MYDIMKELVQIWLPAIATLIFTINSIWALGLPSEQIVATITAICTFLGAVLKISSNAYYKNAEIEEQES